MAYDPAIPVTDVRPIAQNLLAYIEEVQEEVLFWANGGAGLAKFAVIFNTNEGLLYKIFPNLQLLRERARTDYTSDEWNITYSAELLFEVQGADPTQLKKDVRKYGYALESMIQNIPAGVLMEGLGVFTAPIVAVYETEYGPLQGEKGNHLIQSTARVAWQYM